MADDPKVPVPEHEHRYGPLGHCIVCGQIPEDRVVPPAMNWDRGTAPGEKPVASAEPVTPPPPPRLTAKRPPPPPIVPPKEPEE